MYFVTHEAEHVYLYSHILMPLEMTFLIDGSIVSGESFQLSNTCWLLE
jgi:hypothetical protein